MTKAEALKMMRYLHEIKQEGFSERFQAEYGCIADISVQMKVLRCFEVCIQVLEEAIERDQNNNDLSV